MRNNRTLEVTTNIGCSLQCSYCPQDKLVKAYRSSIRRGSARVLTLKAFSEFLRTVPSHVDIHFSGFAEPWHAPECLSMIQAAIEKGHRVAVFTTADRMTLADVGALRELRFKRFLVHLPDECQEMKLAVPADLIEVLVALKEGVTGVEFLTLGVPAKKILNAIGAQQSTRRIHSRAGNIALEGRTVGAAFSAEMIAERNLGSSLICRQDRMFSNVLLPDGTLQFCSMDYGLAHSLGSLADQTYDEIISGPAFRRIFEEMARKDSEILCRRCEYAFPGVYQMKS